MFWTVSQCWLSLLGHEDSRGGSLDPSPVSVIEIPTDSPLPQKCTKCGRGWTAWGTTDTEGEVVLACWAGCRHEHKQNLSPEDLLSFRLAVDQESLVEVPIYIVGTDHPIDPRWMRINPLQHPSGSTIEIDRIAHVVVAYELEKAWVRPVD